MITKYFAQSAQPIAKPSSSQRTQMSSPERAVKREYPASAHSGSWITS